MEFIQITNDPQFALECELAGIQRIMVDLEVLGKRERQRGRDTVLSDHAISDIASVRSRLNSATLMVRINPWGEWSRGEVDQAVDAGADVSMLPMVRDVHQTEELCDAVDGRARTCLLLETASAVARLDGIIGSGGMDEAFVGLNDLHLEMKVDFMFELVSGGLIEWIGNCVQSKGMRFGFGGVSTDEREPISGEEILGEHVRIGSSMVILSRGFAAQAGAEGVGNRPIRLASQMDVLRGSLDRWRSAEASDLESNHATFSSAVAMVVNRVRHSGVELG